MRYLMTAGAVLLVAGLTMAQTDPRTLPPAGPIVPLGALVLPERDSANNRLDYGGVMGLAADGVFYGCFQNGKLARVSWTGALLAPCAGPAMVSPLDTLGGALQVGGRVIVGGYSSYDATGAARVSHAAGASLASMGAWQTMTGGLPGQLGGYVAPVPAEWRALLGGDTITGQGAISIISKSNFGPGVYAFTAADVGVVSPVPAVPLVAYPTDHRTWGDYRVPTTDGYSGPESLGGCFIPAGTSTLSCIWTQATASTECYGNGSPNPADHNKLVGGEWTCYDPSNGYKGPHGYPYKTYRLDYALADLAAVKAGTKQPWDVRPVGRVLLPDSTDIMRVIQGGTVYNPATGELWVTTYEDRALRRIHRYQIGAPAAPPPPPPPPPAEVCGDGVDNNGNGQIDEGCAPPPPPPPPVNVCTAAPIVVSSVAWPGGTEGSRSGRFTWDVAGASPLLVSAAFDFTGGLATSLTLVDSRGCRAVVVR